MWNAYLELRNAATKAMAMRAAGLLQSARPSEAGSETTSNHGQYKCQYHFIIVPATVAVTCKEKWYRELHMSSIYMFNLYDPFPPCIRIALLTSIKYNCRHFSRHKKVRYKQITLKKTERKIYSKQKQKRERRKRKKKCFFMNLLIMILFNVVQRKKLTVLRPVSIK
jgi:hypothetical protein